MKDFILEFTSFLIERKKYWLIPLVIILLLLSLIITLTQGTVIAPFIYTFF